MISIKSTKEIEKMRQSGAMLSKVLKRIESFIEVGVTTNDIEKIALKELKNLGGEPAFLGYGGFPSAICISLNDTVVHGLPSDQLLNSGDLVSVDFGVKYEGYYSDAARTFLIGKEKDPTKHRFLEITKRSLDLAIDEVKIGARIGDLGFVVQNLLESKGYGVVRALVGHGIGRNLHEDPDIPNYGLPRTGEMLKEGMVLAIEPMSTMGGYEVFTDSDGWSIKTFDGSLSAHFEDTVVVGKDGPEILTR
jgi:methionyl aminopeptidase